MEVVYRCILIFCFAYLVGVNCSPFPYKEFFKFGDVGVAEEKERKSDFLCTVGDSWTSLCDCDKDCVKYQTCCIDYMWNTSTSTSLSAYIKQFVSEARKYRPLKCTPIMSNLDKKNLHTSQNLLMVSKCPREATKKMKSLCRRNRKLLPVVGTDDYIYKNEHCAKCNQIDDFEQLKVKADCMDKLPNNKNSSAKQKSILDRYKECNIDIVDDDPQLKKIAKHCSRDVVSRCYPRLSLGKILPTDTTECQVCKYYNSGVYASGDRCCKNPSCCRAELQSVNQTSKQPMICYDVFAKTARTTLLFRQLPSYSILLSYKDAEELENEQDEDNRCLPGDSLLNPECMENTVCPVGQSKVGSKCVEDAPLSIVKTESTQYLPGSNETNCLDNNVFVIVKLNDTGTRKRMMDHLNGTIHSSSFNVRYENETHLVLNIEESNYETVANHLLNHFNIKLIKASVPSVNPNELYGMDFSRSFTGGRTCASPMLHQEGTYEISSNCFVTLNDKRILYVNEYVLYYEVTSKVERKLVTCDTFHLTKRCKLRSILNYTMLANNSIFTDRNMTYSAEEYRPLKHGLAACKEKSKFSKVWLEIVEAVEGYLTVIGSALSIIAYAWTILTYLLISELRTLPGKNIVCLCFTLMACDMLMLLSMVSEWCKYIAICLHFFALSAQFWGVITAFDIWSTFRGKSLSKNLKSKKKRFICYCIWGWLSPLCFVVICVSLDMTNVVEVGYGKYGVCWITNLPARLATYIIPVGMSIIFNVTVLSYTMSRINRQCNKSKTLLKKRGGENVSLAKMALKLVILLGVIEIFGFLQFRGELELSWIITSIFELIYVIVRSFRGVFVWLLYVVTDRVFKIYRNIREQRSYRSTSTKLSSMSRSRATRTYSTRSSDNFNTTLTIAPTPTPS